jgi:hypothetical protein
MAHFWQCPLWDKLRSGEWLTSPRARGYSLILLGISVIVAATRRLRLALSAVFLCGRRSFSSPLFPMAGVFRSDWWRV